MMARQIMFTCHRDVHDDLSNMYWLYKPEDAMLSGTVMGQQTTEGGENIEAVNKAEPLTVSSRKNYYPDYRILLLI